MFRLIGLILIIFVSYVAGFGNGFDYAKNIALGIRRVKYGKDFMKEYRKVIGWK